MPFSLWRVRRARAAVPSIQISTGQAIAREFAENAEGRNGSGAAQAGWHRKGSFRAPYGRLQGISKVVGRCC